eukprot:gnl/TRDRNA2_/TRDRNA2_83262_c0_seq2.p1 gnl/TRDRNA2_/TRDRNA2_83262_c0~~gnl/TRDRNA2_/TRDRNA2_83262_c0_seq2.p1  ORF type:complete len:251 (+),score=64.92 gnl/TRDRNA2_/TRDRNA2_83262_c0_seq2:42-755(+)
MAAEGDGVNPEARAAMVMEARAMFEETGIFPDGRWQHMCHVKKTWVDVGEAENETLKDAFLNVWEVPQVEYLVGRVPYETDITLLRRKNKASGRLSELRFSGILPFDPPAPDPSAVVDAADQPFAERRAAEVAAGREADEVWERLEQALDEQDAEAVRSELEALQELLNSSLTYARCVELRLGKLVGRAQKEMQGTDKDSVAARELAATAVKKIFKLSQGGSARLVSDPIKRAAEKV